MGDLKLAVTTKKVRRATWVQTEREVHEAWAELIGKSPKAAQLMHILTARMGDNNALVVSLPVLAKIMKCSRPTAIRAIQVLKSGNWIESVQIGGSGTVNAYVINDRVAWTQSRENLRYSLFSATVITSSDEQPDESLLDNQKPLRQLPKVGELQVPFGDGLPPPSQPSLPDLEPELPASGEQTDLEDFIK
ncbi:helix-turn-helix domain-containing protein [Bartonella apis]|uniref:helix-turn-helix domain-containing protein n=1 Tax=Bartonella apis TaxID=1686310 RepID=UPI00095F79A7|nr:helix-turn-helix domain-containing protein [Bartonella apis]OLY46919.1 hypothetical protein PEB0122_022550 [Bartonella apis]